MKLLQRITSIGNINIISTATTMVYNKRQRQKGKAINLQNFMSSFIFAKAVQWVDCYQADFIFDYI